MKKQISLLVLLITLLMSCAPTVPPKELLDMVPEMMQCLKDNAPSVAWDGKFTMIEGNGGYAQIKGKADASGMDIKNVNIGNLDSLAKQKVVLKKETCLNGQVAQEIYSQCMLDETECMPVLARKPYLDGMSTSLLTEDEQKLFIKGSILHFDKPLWLLDCDTLDVFQEWSEEGIIQGDVNELVIFFHPSGCP